MKKSLYIPKGHEEICEGHYSNDELAELLRRLAANPSAIQFVADMIEDGEG